MSRRKILIIALCVLAVLLIIFILATLRDADREAPREMELLPAPMLTPEATALTVRYEGEFELPVQGATGYAAIALKLRSAPDAASESRGTLPAGSGFRILGEQNGYWQVESGLGPGYVAHRWCMINLPDVIPSIVYDNTNSYDSKIVSSGKALPGVTGEALYPNAAYNPRLGWEEFIMPVLYTMAKKIQAAQTAALAEGNALKIYEAYRPHEVQREVVNALNNLAAENAQVRRGISTPPWKVSWFASQGTSQHQRGCAIDVSLVKVDRMEESTSGSYVCDRIAAYTEYEMPTAIHELSIAAAALSRPVASTSASAWRSVEPAKAMNAAALALQRYCTGAGLTPLASEWWHFNDLDAYAEIKESPGEGKFILTGVYSAEA